MNERIKELAEQAGFQIAPTTKNYGVWYAADNVIERFAELVRQDEREKCAKLCDEARAARLAELIRGRTE